MTNPSETAWRDTSRSGLASLVPRSNSVRIVARLMIRKSETTRLEIVSSVRRLFRRMFLKISFAYFIVGHRAEYDTSKLLRVQGETCSLNALFSLCNLGVLCVSVVIFRKQTTETQRTPRLH